MRYNLVGVHVCCGGGVVDGSFVSFSMATNTLKILLVFNFYIEVSGTVVWGSFHRIDTPKKPHRSISIELTSLATLNKLGKP